MNIETPNHLGDIIKNEAPKTSDEINYYPIQQLILWIVKSIIILAREVALLKQRTP